MTYETARPHCKEPRKNGLPNKPGNFIKQSLIGRFSGFPYEWFGASAWNAHLISENDYYHYDDGYSAKYLKKVNCVPCNGYITRNVMREFIENGRQEAVKAGIDFLIEELSKDENKRRILLIRDIPSNVELWIAAIISAFPEFVSKEIPFSTNKTRFAFSKITGVLFYYSDKKNQSYSPFYNKEKGLTERHPQFMIVGFHPKDPFCYHISQEENDDYVLVDGVQKSALFETNNRMRRIFYEDAVIQNDKFLIFRDTILPNVGQLEDVSDITDLYDIYSREWEICSDIKRREENVLSACKEYLVNGRPKKNIIKEASAKATERNESRFVNDKPQKYKIKEILKLFRKKSS